MSYKWMIGLTIASHLIVVGPAEAEKKHPFECASSSEPSAFKVINIGARTNEGRPGTTGFKVDNSTAVTWISKSTSWDARKYQQWIQEYQEALWAEDVISSMFGYFDLDELVLVTKLDEKSKFLIVVIGTTGEEKKFKVKTKHFERLPWTRTTQSERGIR